MNTGSFFEFLVPWRIMLADEGQATQFYRLGEVK